MIRSRELPRAPERGQALILVTIFLMALLGMCAMGIDAGNWYLTKRRLQAAADAAALSGAAALPTSSLAAQNAARAQYLKNAQASDSVTYAITTRQSANDSITVTASRTVNNGFAQLFGMSQTTVRVSARATVQSFTRVVSHQNVMPWGVLQGSYTPGSMYPIYTKDTNNANAGALQLPYTGGANCPAPSGANDYKDEITGGKNACDITLGEVIDTKPGNNSGPTGQGLSERVPGTWQTLNQIVQQNPDGTWTVVDPASKQLVMLPVVVNTDGTSTWPNGTSGHMRVVGFAWFVVVSCGDPANPSYCSSSDGKQVNGVFITMSTPDSSYTTGAWNGSSSSAYTYGLSA
jgi:Flp pilus assembly protein TadG